jgi:chromosome segregation ATPase
MVFAKVKGLMEVDEKIDQLTAKVADHSAKIDEHTRAVEQSAGAVKCLKEEISHVNTDTANIYLEFMEQLNQTKKLNEELKDDIYDFKLIKGQLKTKLVEELTESFRQEMSAQSRKIEADIKTYNALREQLDKVVAEIKAFQEEVGKFRQISSQIKSADFELAKYAREVTMIARDKEELLARADRLESAIARERRNKKP